VLCDLMAEAYIDRTIMYGGRSMTWRLRGNQITPGLVLLYNVVESFCLFSSTWARRRIDPNHFLTKTRLRMH